MTTNNSVASTTDRNRRNISSSHRHFPLECFSPYFIATRSQRSLLNIEYLKWQLRHQVFNWPHHFILIWGCWNYGKKSIFDADILIQASKDLADIPFKSQPFITERPTHILNIHKMENFNSWQFLFNLFVWWGGGDVLNIRRDLVE